MKVLHVSGAKSWGGNEQQLVAVIPELEKYGVENYIFGVKDSPLYNYCKKAKIKFINRKTNKFNNYKFFKNVVNSVKPDIIHLHTSDSVTLYTVSDMLFRLKTPTVFSKKGISSKTSYLSKLKYNYKNINKVLCVSGVVKNHFKEVLTPKNHFKLKVVYDGVTVSENNEASDLDIRKEYTINEQIKIVGNIANHTKAKNLETFIRTLDVLVNKKNIKNIHFIQIGEETDKTKDLKLLVKNLQLERYITFVGFKENASLLLPQFDVFLMTSVREGGPTSVLEAFNKKVPVISTRVGVIGEALEDGINGFVSNTGDYAELANNVALLINDENLKKSFAKISYQKFTKFFTTKKLGENTFNIYKSML